MPHLKACLFRLRYAASSLVTPTDVAAHAAHAALALDSVLPAVCAALSRITPSVDEAGTSLFDIALRPRPVTELAQVIFVSTFGPKLQAACNR